jgi:hypothetical protein
VDGQCVAGFGTLDPERSGLRVEIFGVQRGAGDVGSAGDTAAVGILGPQRQHGGRPDPHNRLRAAEGERELFRRRDERDVIHPVILVPSSRDCSVVAETGPYDGRHRWWPAAAARGPSGCQAEWEQLDQACSTLRNPYFK